MKSGPPWAKLASAPPSAPGAHSSPSTQGIEPLKSGGPPWAKSVLARSSHRHPHVVEAEILHVLQQVLPVDGLLLGAAADLPSARRPLLLDELLQQRARPGFQHLLQLREQHIAQRGAQRRLQQLPSREAPAEPPQAVRATQLQRRRLRAVCRLRGDGRVEDSLGGGVHEVRLHDAIEGAPQACKAIARRLDAGEPLQVRL
mmetsp:Transcript_57525/g.147955  ORF Transcript_57525/g.147955 Transcript_57525/m.147955 type:complete len:201 (-) Transcript_57525:325-927(-)